MNPTEFVTALQNHNIQINATQLQQFETYYRMLVETNEKVNLTAITDKPAVFLKHFYDSITPAFYVTALQTERLTICDVGAGAGFPSLPLKILFPQLKITIIDSLNKRIHFLQELVTALQLDDVRLVHDRAELFGQGADREQYDLVTARAVAPLNVLAEFCLPLVKVGGQFVALKASQSEQELTQAQYALTLLGGQVVSEQAFKLPQTEDPRHLLVIDKVQATPTRYPRRAGMPVKRPLMAKEVR